MRYRELQNRTTKSRDFIKQREISFNAARDDISAKIKQIIDIKIFARERKSVIHEKQHYS